MKEAWKYIFYEKCNFSFEEWFAYSTYIFMIVRAVPLDSSAPKHFLYPWSKPYDVVLAPPNNKSSI